MNLKLSSATVKNGYPLSIAGPGKFLKIVRTLPLALVTINTDSGQTIDAVSGIQIEFKASVKSAVLTCPGAGVDVQIQYYIGDFAYHETARTEPGQTIITTDYITLDASSSILIPGTRTLNGVTFRRKKLSLTNLTGMAGYGASTQAFWNSNYVARASFVKVEGNFAFGNGLVLPPSDGTRLFPQAFETDDDVYANTIAGNAVDLSIVQTWVLVNT
jgi:hypothetical protein